MFSAKTPDQIVKRIRGFLDKVPVSRLRELGWFDFQNHDHPETSDVVTLAYNAFAYLSIGEDGNWNNAQDVLTAILAFLKAETGYSYSTSQLQELAVLLKEQPIRSKAVETWFEQTFL